jgi:hypothetical protein
VFITNGQSNYDRVLAELLETVHSTGATANAVALGGSANGDTVTVPLFGSDCHVLRDGIYRNGHKIDVIGSILTVRYLLQAGGVNLQNLWRPYRDLKDGAQFAHHIKVHLEDKIASFFSEKVGILKERLRVIGGEPLPAEVQSDVAMVVHPLPRVPVLCLFWDEDEEFPATFQFLFDASATTYLDLESLAAALQYIYLKITEEV